MLEESIKYGSDDSLKLLKTNYWKFYYPRKINFDNSSEIPTVFF